MVCRSTPFLARWNPALLFILIVAAVWQPCSLRAQTYSSPITLYTFSGPDGEYPNPGLMMDSQGNLYGVTAEGGPAFTFLNGGNDAYGTIFKYSIASGTLTTLAAFDGLDGYKPTQTRVTIDGSGNLWGATYQGGVDWNPLKNHLGWGTVWEISSTGAFTPGIAEFSGPDGANAIGNLALD